MGELQLKNVLHDLIDQQKDTSMLIAIHDFLSHYQNHEDGKMWEELTDKQRTHLLESFNDSNDDSQLKPASHILKV